MNPMPVKHAIKRLLLLVNNQSQQCRLEKSRELESELLKESEYYTPLFPVSACRIVVHSIAMFKH